MSSVLFQQVVEELVHDLGRDGECRIVALQRFLRCSDELLTQQCDSPFADFENVLKLGLLLARVESEMVTIETLLLPECLQCLDDVLFDGLDEVSLVLSVVRTSDDSSCDVLEDSGHLIPDPLFCVRPALDACRLA